MIHQETNQPVKLPYRQVIDEKIRQIEEKYDLLKFTVNGWSIWPVLRFRIFLDQVKLPTGKTPGKTRYSKIKSLSGSFMELLRLLFTRKVKYVVLTQSTARAEREGNLFKDIFFDDFLKDERSFIKIENETNPFFLLRSKQAYVKSDLTLNFLTLPLAILTRLPPSREIKITAKEIYKILKIELVGNYYSLNTITRTLKNFEVSRKIFRFFLNRIQPQYLLVITSYIFHPIIAAAKELGIPIIEFQHGILDKNHNGYSWTPYALPYHHQLPIPDRLFLYGDFWKNELSKNGFWQERAVSVGSLRIDTYRKKRAERPETLTLLVTTQNIDTDKINAFIRDVVLLFREENTPLRVIIKLHPGEVDKKEYEQTFSDMEEVSTYLSSEGKSTFELLTESDLHTSIYSTCHYEALGLGKPTAILPFTNHETVFHLLDTGSAFPVETPKDMVSLLKRSRDLLVPQEVGNYFFTHNALNNIHKMIP